MFLSCRQPRRRPFKLQAPLQLRMKVPCKSQRSRDLSFCPFWCALSFCIGINLQETFKTLKRIAIFHALIYLHLRENRAARQATFIRAVLSSSMVSSGDTCIVQEQTFLQSVASDGRLHLVGLIIEGNASEERRWKISPRSLKYMTGCYGSGSDLESRLEL